MDDLFTQWTEVCVNVKVASLQLTGQAKFESFFILEGLSIIEAMLGRLDFEV